MTPPTPADRTPVVVAVGQSVSRDGQAGPIDLLESATRAALEAATGLPAVIERLTVVNVLSRRAGPRPASALADALGRRRLRGLRRLETTSVGGNTPQAMVERAALDIAAGRLAATVIAGADAVRTGRLRSGGRPEAGPDPASPSPSSPAASPSAPPGPPPAARAEADPVVGTDRQDLSDEERAAGMSIPLFVYPYFESVLAGRAGRSPAEQRRYLGELLSPLTRRARDNPYAWFRQPRSAAEISVPSADNRLVAEPYTKTMVAFLGAAQGAALVVTSLAVARKLGLDDGCIFPWSSATACDVWYPVARPDLGRSPALEAAAGAALGAAGVGIDDVGLLDVYSCFPSALQIGAEAIGAGARLARPADLSLTGGLPYFGGPGNDYTTHAIAALFAELGRQAPGALGLVNGVGWYLTKHSVGLYGSEPPPGGFRSPDLGRAQAAIDVAARPYVTHPELAAGALSGRGEATVEASSVFYGRDGSPSGAPVIATLEDGRRIVAAADPAELTSVAAAGAERWLVGSRVTVEAAPGGPALYHLERPSREPSHRDTKELR